MTTTAFIPDDEADRLRTIERYNLGGVGREAAFDNITQLASAIFSVPISLVSIVDSDAQCFRGATGLDVPGTSRDIAFCAFAILDQDVMVVEDAREDPRFRDNPLVTGAPSIRFYAGAPLRMRNGQPVGTLCLIDQEPRAFPAEQRNRLRLLADSLVDIIELRRDRFRADEEHDRALRERELLKLTVENVREGVALIDGNFRLILWNEAFLDLFGYEASQVYEGADAKSLMLATARRGDLGKGDSEDIVRAFVQSIISSDSRRIEIQRRNGRVLDIWRCSIPGGRFIMAARDATLERQTARLKDELVSTVSHELRTPLTAIAGALGLVAAGAAGPLPPKAHKLVDVARRNSDRLRRLVDDLLDLDKLQSGQLRMEIATSDLRSVIEDVAEQNQPFAQQHDVGIVIEMPESPVMVGMDSGRIGQVITNLLSNAVKHAPSGSEVRLRLTQDSVSARITVSDDGPGISPEFRERLFTRFAQEDSGDNRRNTGTGLGLAISKSIVDLHGGRIELDPDAGCGASFSVFLPAAAA